MKKILTFLLLLFCQSCTASEPILKTNPSGIRFNNEKINHASPKSQKEDSKTNLNKMQNEVSKKTKIEEEKTTNHPKQITNTTFHNDEDPNKIIHKVGTNISKVLSDIEVQNHNFETTKLINLINKNNRKTVVIVVKPKCIFCESFLAELSSSKKQFKGNIVILLDAEHTDIEAFKEKYTSFPTLHKHTWIYDFQNKFIHEFNIHAFPRFIILDNKMKIKADQKGLTPPKNRESLRGQAIPVILQKLCEGTSEWLSKQ